MTSSATFELTLQSTAVEDIFRLVAEWSQPGALPVRRERELRIAGAEKNPALLEAVDPLGYGTVLGQLIFEGGVRDLFVQARAAAPRLRVLLAVEVRRLQTLRWERLCGPFEDDRWLFLSTQARTPFSQFLPSTTDRLFLPFGRRDLRALVVVASPQVGNGFGLEPFDEAQALDTALGGLGEIPATVLAKSKGAAGPPTLKQICAQLIAQRYTLLHLICHGALGRSGETAIFLDGDDGKAVAVRASEFIDRLRELSSARGLPHLAFLSVCDSAKPEAEAALGGLGQRLVRELGMPAVVAMTEKISQATALALGRAFYPRLREHGEADRALGEACVEVRERIDAVVPALFSRLSGRPLFSDDLDRPLRAAEIAAATTSLDALFAERAPVLRTRVAALGAAAGSYSEAAVLSDDDLRERQARLAELEQLCEDALELSFSALAHGRKPPPYDVACPFPGLRAFTAMQRRYFRGRDALVETLLAQLRGQSFLAVLGSSGCGKSSLVMAGVIPRLLDDNPALRVAQFKPGAHPSEALATALKELADASDAIIYADQFEEVFTLCGDKKERNEFLDALLGAASLRRKVLVSMRADFIGECAEHKGLRERVEGLKLIPPMASDELRNAVEEQARAAGLRYETGLCELILQDLKEEPGAMPLLQHALHELYERRHGRWLRVRAYEELGRVQKAITKTAESAWEKLDAEDQARLRSVMLELTEVSEAESGGPARYTRRRVALNTLYYMTPAEEPAIKRLVNLLADERLLVKSRDEQAGDVVEVAHEALLRGWERLQGWLTAARDALRLRQDLEDAARGWRSHGKARAYLEHLHERAELVRSFLRSGTLKLDSTLKEYFDACAAEQQRQLQEKQQQQERELAAAKQLAAEQQRRARVLRVAALVLSAAFLGAVAAGLQALRKSAEAKRSATMATAATQRALDGFIELGRQALSAGRPREALVYLTEAERGQRVTPLTRFLLARAAIELDMLTLKGSADAVLAVSPDGNQLFLVGADGRLQAFDTATGKPLDVHTTRPGDSGSPAISSDGKRLVIVDASEGVARLWELASGKAIATFRHPPEADAKIPVNSAAFSPDGLRIVTTGGLAIESGSAAHIQVGHLSPHVTLWDGKTGAPVTELAGHLAVARAAFAPDGRRLVTVDMLGQTRLWDGRSGVLIKALPGQQGELRDLAFTPDGQKFVTAGMDRTPRLFSAENGAPGPMFSGHLDSVASARFSASGRRLVTAGRDQTARLWDTSSGALLRTLGHGAALTAADFSPDESTVITGDEEGRIWLWDAPSGVLRTGLGGGSAIRSVGFTPDGKRIVARAGDGSIRIADVLTAGVAARMLGGHRGAVLSATFTPDGTRLATSGYREPELEAVAAWAPRPGAKTLTAGWWDVATGTLLAPLVDAVTVRSIRVSPRGDRILAGKEDGTASIWDARSGRALLTIDTVPPGVESTCSMLGGSAHPDCDAAISDVNFLLDGAQVEIRGGTTSRWDAVSGKSLASPATPSPGSSTDAARNRPLAVSPDGAMLLTVDPNSPQQAYIKDAATGKQLSSLAGHTMYVTAAAFSPDGKRLVTGSADRIVRLWDSDTGELHAAIAGHTESVTFVGFSPDGRKVVSGSADQTARLWDVHLETRAPAVIDRLVRCRIPLRLQNGRITAATPTPLDCNDAVAAPAARPPVAFSETPDPSVQVAAPPPAAPAPPAVGAAPVTPVPPSVETPAAPLSLELDGVPLGAIHSLKWLPVDGGQELPTASMRKRSPRRMAPLEVSRPFDGSPTLFDWFNESLNRAAAKSVSIVLRAGASGESRRIRLLSCTPISWTSTDLGSRAPLLPTESIRLSCASASDAK